MGLFSVKIGNISVDFKEIRTGDKTRILEHEAAGYIQHAKSIMSSQEFSNLQRILVVDVPEKDDEGFDQVDLEYVYKPVPFARLRRITGYLVGTTDRWNDGKTAELNDRVKHSVE